MMHFLRLVVCGAAAFFPTQAIVARKGQGGNIKELLDRLSGAEASHPMSLEEFTPICLKHVAGLIRAVDLAYTDAQLGHTLKGECKLSHAFPSAYEHGYVNQCACLSFSDHLVKARDAELANGDTKLYKEFCAAFHGHGADVPECKVSAAQPKPAAKAAAQPAAQKAAQKKNAPKEKEVSLPFDSLKEPAKKAADKGQQEKASAAKKAAAEEEVAKKTKEKAVVEKAAAEEKLAVAKAAKKAEQEKTIIAEEAAKHAAAEEDVKAKKEAAKKATADAGAAKAAAAGAKKDAAPAPMAASGGGAAAGGAASAQGSKGSALGGDMSEDYENRAQIPEEEIDGMDNPDKNKHAAHWQNMRERGRRYGSQYRMESSDRGNNYKHDDTPPRNKEEWESTAITHVSHHDMPLPVEEDKPAAPKQYSRAKMVGFAAFPVAILAALAL